MSMMLEREQDDLLEEKERLEKKLKRIDERLEEISNHLAREDEEERNREYWNNQF